MDKVARVRRTQGRRVGEGPKYDSYHRLFSLLFLVLFLGLLIAMSLYGEPFDFWNYPYNGLGATETVNGYGNHAALIAFATDMICIAIVLIAISIVCAGDYALPHRVIHTFFSATGAFGAFVATFPHNIYPSQHTFGSAFLVGSLWALSVLYIVDVMAIVSAALGVWLHLVLHTSVVSYAVAYILDAVSKQVFQKFAVFGLCAVVLCASRLLARSTRYQPAEAPEFGMLDPG